jgi:hypothetical protein
MLLNTVALFIAYFKFLSDSRINRCTYAAEQKYSNFAHQWYVLIEQPGEMEVFDLAGRLEGRRLIML